MNKRKKKLACLKFSYINETDNTKFFMNNFFENLEVGEAIISKMVENRENMFLPPLPIQLMTVNRPNILWIWEKILVIFRPWKLKKKKKPQKSLETTLGQRWVQNEKFETTVKPLWFQNKRPFSKIRLIRIIWCLKNITI